MHGLRLSWPDDNTVSEKLIRKMMDAEKIYASAETLSASVRIELTRMSQVVFAALVYVHCSLEAPHLLGPVASRCCFVGSSHGPEKTAVLRDVVVSMFQTASCSCLST